MVGNTSITSEVFRVAALQNFEIKKLESKGKSDFVFFESGDFVVAINNKELDKIPSILYKKVKVTIEILDK